MHDTHTLLLKVLNAVGLVQNGTGQLLELVLD